MKQGDKMKKIKWLFLCTAILSLNGCMSLMAAQEQKETTQHPYHPLNKMGGYTDMQFAPEIYKVTFYGNPYLSVDAVQTLTLIRCAEITKQNDYKYFIILTAATNVNRAYRATPTVAYSNGMANYYGNFNNNGFNANGFGNSFTTVVPGSTREIDSYTSIAVIRLLKNNKKYSTAFNAESILHSTVNHQ